MKLTGWHCLGVVLCLCLFVLMGCNARRLPCCGFYFTLFVAGRNGGCGLLEAHAGRSQLVSDSSTVALSPFGCVLCFVVCDVCFWLLLCLCSSLLCCDCGCGGIVDCVVVAVGFVLDFVLFLFSVCDVMCWRL